MESACNVWGEDSPDEVLELVGETVVLKEALLLDLGALCPKEDCVMNFGWEWDRRSEVEEK